MRHAYETLLRLYPEAFRRRYGTEMSLDFAEGWAEARAVGPVATVVFASRVAGDLVVSLLREWTRGFRVAIAAATAGVTLLLWSVALRPWAWQWDMQIGPPPQAISVRDEKRRFYRLTADGRQALGTEVKRLEDLVRLARRSRGVPKAARH